MHVTVSNAKSVRVLFFGVSSYFDDGKIESIEGKSNTYEAPSDSSRVSTRYFCPECGTTVYWKAGVFPDKTGIAVGCFGDPNFPQPQAVVWTASQHSWVTYPEGLPSSEIQELNQ